MPAKSIHKLY